MAPKVTFWGPFSELGVTCGVILGSQLPSRAHPKSFQKIIEFFVIFRVPQGEGAIATGGAPGQQKTHIFSKSSVFAAEGCKFSDSGFRYPLREVSFTDFL